MTLLLTQCCLRPEILDSLAEAGRFTAQRCPPTAGGAAGGVPRYAWVAARVILPVLGPMRCREMLLSRCPRPPFSVPEDATQHRQLD